MLRKVKYIHMIKLVRYFMRIMPLALPFVLVSCQKNEENIPEQFSEKDVVTVKLNLSTRGLEVGRSELLDEYSSEPANWYKTGTLFPQAPSVPRLALMIFNKDLNRCVYRRLLPFSSTIVDGQYQTKIRIPRGETELYALYAPNQTGKDLPYYTAAGVLQDKIPWDFSGSAVEEISEKEFAGVAFPAIIKEKNDGSLGLPVNNPYDGTTPAPADEKIIDWTETSKAAWDDLPGISNRLHLSMLSGKLVTSVQPISGKQEQEISVPLFRDFARVRIYIASAVRSDQAIYDYKRIAFLNFPILMSPSFRENDSERTQLAASTPGVANIMEHTGTYSYGIKNDLQLSIPEVPLTTEGQIDYVQMETRKYEQFCLPQYLAPYIPESNFWQKKQNHPRVQLTLESRTGGGVSKTKTFLFDVGEESSPGVYSGPIYPNRDYKVFIVLPESSDKEIIYRVEAWKSKKVDLPPFQ